MLCCTQFQSPRSRATVRRSRRLLFEPLEDRSLLTFLGPVNYPIGTPDEHSAADFDNDGILDLIVKNASMVSMMRGNGDGTFQPAVDFNASTTPSLGGDTYSLAVEDFNTDGNLDVVTTTDHCVSLLLGDGDGSLGTPITVDWLGRGGYVAAGDFNADGKLDLAVATIDAYLGEDDSYYIPFVRVLLGDGHGGFSPQTIIQAGELGYYNTISVAIADLNGDAMQDLVVGVPDGTVSVMLNDGLGNLQAPTAFPGGWQFPSPGDMDGDGDIDLVTVGNFVIVLKNDGLGGFGPPQKYFVGDHEGCFLLRDFNNDGKLDIAMTEGWKRDLTVVLGKGDGTFSTPLMFDGPGGRFGSTAGDFNGDGWLDLATSNTRFAGFSVWINDHAWPAAGAPSLTINDVTVLEGNSGTTEANFTVTLSGASDQPVTVAYATADGTATAGSDYQAIFGTLTFAPGETEKTITVQVNGDTLAEGDEYLAVNVTGVNGAILSGGWASGTILNDDPPPALYIGDASVVEGNSGTKLLTFTVSLSKAGGQDLWVNYATANGTATTSNNDYVAASGRLDFAAGETTKTITVTIRGDTRKEANEYFLVKLSGAVGATIADGQGEGTIANDDGGGKLNGKVSRSTSYASAVDAAIDDWMASTPKKRGP